MIYKLLFILFFSTSDTLIKIEDNYHKVYVKNKCVDTLTLDQVLEYNMSLDTLNYRSKALKELRKIIDP